MRPLVLEMHNFMSYREAFIDFSEINLASVVGPNGAGKSTILQAITYVLWGKVRTASHNDAVRRGTQSCSVRLRFLVGIDEYIVTRRRDTSS